MDNQEIYWRTPGLGPMSLMDEPANAPTSASANDLVREVLQQIHRITEVQRATQNKLFGPRPEPSCGDAQKQAHEPSLLQLWQAATVLAREAYSRAEEINSAL